MGATVVFRDLPAQPAPQGSEADWVRHAGEWGARAWADGLTGGPRIVVTETARSVLLAHVSASVHERGGLLVGEVAALADHSAFPFLVLVTAAVPAPALASGPAWLTMHAGVWAEAAPWLDAGRRVVGWYHSHPNWGVFFSDVDRRTQRGFFSQPFSVGLVVDWQRGRAGVFTGAESRPHDEASDRDWDPVYGRTSGLVPRPGRAGPSATP